MSGIRLAVGIPTFQEADSIENVARQVDAGLTRLADPADCVIVNVDSDSPDGTAEVFSHTPSRCRLESISIADQPRGKGRNVLRFFERCVELGVHALAIVDGDLRSITPDWVEALLTPALRGEADYVTPLYLRHRFDGAMTNHFAFPLMYGYFGAPIRQPVGGEFAFSIDLIRRLLRQPADEAALGYGIDIFLSIHAVGGGFRVAQVKLGRKLHKPSLQKRRFIQPQAIAGAISAIRSYRMRADAPDFDRLPDSVENLPEYCFYDESQALLAESRAQARKLKPVYAAWLGGEREDLFSSFEDGGPPLTMRDWTDLLAAGIACAAWGERGVPARAFAAPLGHALFIRTITNWNESWRRPIEEFNSEINQQALLLREKLQAYARRFGQEGVTPNSS
jgi:glycosyltransferase involved in cell wall biosynthesis